MIEREAEWRKYRDTLLERKSHYTFGICIDSRIYWWPVDRWIIRDFCKFDILKMTII